MIATSPIQIATKNDIARIIDAMTLAFATDPIVRWMYPDSQQYLKQFPNFVKAFGSKSIESNTTYFIEGYKGAAFWFPPNTEPDEEALGNLLQQTVSHAEEVFGLLEQMSHYHPSEPCWYLGILGVDPIQQGQGYGSALMEDILALCDREKKVAYLESSKLSNIPFYERRGFEVMGQIQAGDSPTLFPMVRNPR
ncbi:GNAT family N-acetyltransferase [Lusitaniella coriacea]|uniref:GNAT family N-acetyltransferase n=1 Tax=Lusitaniella coriacea TaxID=1983105 RepID=UPI003CF4D686